MIAPAELVRSHGGSYATALGIDLASADSGERFKWFLAAILYGTRITEQLATRTWHEFAARGVLAPQRIVDTGWDGLVAILDAGGYVRYDFKTATKLLTVCTTLLRDYAGDLDMLHRRRDRSARSGSTAQGTGQGHRRHDRRDILARAARHLEQGRAAAVAIGAGRGADTGLPPAWPPDCRTRAGTVAAGVGK